MSDPDPGVYLRNGGDAGIGMLRCGGYGLCWCRWQRKSGQEDILRVNGIHSSGKERYVIQFSQERRVVLRLLYGSCDRKTTCSKAPPENPAALPSSVSLALAL